MTKHAKGLSEKDELIKSLHERASKIESKHIKIALETKIDILENNKTVSK